jgi:hypothetical protein
VLLWQSSGTGNATVVGVMTDVSLEGTSPASLFLKGKQMPRKTGLDQVTKTGLLMILWCVCIAITAYITIFTPAIKVLLGLETGLDK